MRNTELLGNFESKLTRKPAEEAGSTIVGKVGDIMSHFSPEIIEESNPEILQDVWERQKNWKSLARELNLDETLVRFETIFNLNTGEAITGHPKGDIFCLSIGEIGSENELNIWMNNSNYPVDMCLMDPSINLSRLSLHSTHFKILQEFTKSWNNSQRRKFFRYVLGLEDGQYILGDLVGDDSKLGNELDIVQVGKTISFCKGEIEDLKMRWLRNPVYM